MRIAQLRIGQPSLIKLSCRLQVQSGVSLCEVAFEWQVHNIHRYLRPALLQTALALQERNFLHDPHFECRGMTMHAAPNHLQCMCHTCSSISCFGTCSSRT